MKPRRVSIQIISRCTDCVERESCELFTICGGIPERCMRSFIEGDSNKNSVTKEHQLRTYGGTK